MPDPIRNDTHRPHHTPRTILPLFRIRKWDLWQSERQYLQNNSRNAQETR